jgi:putative transposase
MLLGGFRFKLQPTDEQEALFRQFSGVCRLVYNLALEQRRDHYRQYRRQTGQHLSDVAQAGELTALRAEFDWIAAVSQTCQQQTSRDLDKAYGHFFAGRASWQERPAGRFPLFVAENLNQGERFGVARRQGVGRGFLIVWRRRGRKLAPPNNCP